MLYRSKFEDRVAEQLKASGIPYSYEEYEFPYQTKALHCECTNCGEKDTIVHNKKYTPDFFLANGIILEVKGRFTTKDRKIMKAMKEQYPDEDFRLVFMNDNKLRRNTETRYSDWCAQNDIQYCIRTIPLGWLK